MTRLITKVTFLLSLTITTLIYSCQNNVKQISEKEWVTTISDTSLYNYISDYIKFEKQNNHDFFNDNVVIVDVSRIQDSVNFYLESYFKFNIYSIYKSFIDSNKIKYYNQVKIDNVKIYFGSGVDYYLEIKCKNENTTSKKVVYGEDPDLYVLTIKYGEKTEVIRSKFLYKQKYDSISKADSIAYSKTPLILRKRSVLGN